MIGEKENSRIAKDKDLASNKEEVLATQVEAPIVNGS